MADPSTYRCRSPVAFVIFKRWDVTARVFERIREARPPRLLVLADAGRNDAEREACARTRAIVDGVDWPCEVLRNYSDVNLGCRRRIGGGLDWVFEQVPEAIILEDDCLPHPAFFRYCDELLERYRDDERVSMIGGSHHQAGRFDAEASYFFSRHSMIWGWATWRRAWRHFDGALRGWPAFRDAGGVERLLRDPAIAAYWTRIFERMRLAKRPDSWAYPWVFSNFARGALTIVPNVNLISNIGFGTGATHTEQDPLGHADLPVFDPGELRHPREVAWDEAMDRQLFEYAYGGPRVRAWYAKEQTLHRKLKRRWDAFRWRVGLKR